MSYTLPAVCLYACLQHVLATLQPCPCSFVCREWDNTCVRLISPVHRTGDERALGWRGSVSRKNIKKNRNQKKKRKAAESEENHFVFRVTLKAHAHTNTLYEAANSSSLFYRTPPPYLQHAAPQPQEEQHSMNGHNIFGWFSSVLQQQ